MMKVMEIMTATQYPSTQPDRTLEPTPVLPSPPPSAHSITHARSSELPFTGSVHMPAPVAISTNQLTTPPVAYLARSTSRSSIHSLSSSESMTMSSSTLARSNTFSHRSSRSRNVTGMAAVGPRAQSLPPQPPVAQSTLSPVDSAGTSSSPSSYRPHPTAFNGIASNGPMSTGRYDYGVDIPLTYAYAPPTRPPSAASSISMTTFRSSPLAGPALSFNDSSSSISEPSDVDPSTDTSPESEGNSSTDAGSGIDPEQSNSNGQKPPNAKANNNPKGLFSIFNLPLPFPIGMGATTCAASSKHESISRSTRSRIRVDKKNKKLKINRQPSIDRGTEVREGKIGRSKGTTCRMYPSPPLTPTSTSTPAPTPIPTRAPTPTDTTPVRPPRSSLRPSTAPASSSTPASAHLHPHAHLRVRALARASTVSAGPTGLASNPTVTFSTDQAGTQPVRKPTSTWLATGGPTPPFSRAALRSGEVILPVRKDAWAQSIAHARTGKGNSRRLERVPSPIPVLSPGADTNAGRRVLSTRNVTSHPKSSIAGSASTKNADSEKDNRTIHTFTEYTPFASRGSLSFDENRCKAGQFRSKEENPEECLDVREEKCDQVCGAGTETISKRGKPRSYLGDPEPLFFSPAPRRTGSTRSKLSSTSQSQLEPQIETSKEIVVTSVEDAGSEDRKSDSNTGFPKATDVQELNILAQSTSAVDSEHIYAPGANCFDDRQPERTGQDEIIGEQQSTRHSMNEGMNVHCSREDMAEGGAKEKRTKRISHLRALPRKVKTLFQSHREVFDVVKQDKEKHPDNPLPRQQVHRPPQTHNRARYPVLLPAPNVNLKSKLRTMLTNVQNRPFGGEHSQVSEPVQSVQVSVQVENHESSVNGVAMTQDMTRLDKKPSVHSVRRGQECISAKKQSVKAGAIKQSGWSISTSAKRSNHESKVDIKDKAYSSSTQRPILSDNLNHDPHTRIQRRWLSGPLSLRKPRRMVSIAKRRRTNSAPPMLPPLPARSTLSLARIVEETRRSSTCRSGTNNNGGISRYSDLGKPIEATGRRRDQGRFIEVLGSSHNIELAPADTQEFDDFQIGKDGVGGSTSRKGLSGIGIGFRSGLQLGQHRMSRALQVRFSSSDSRSHSASLNG